MIALADIAAYTVALGIAAAIPGPGITALVARSVGSGTRAGFSMLTGIILGDLCYLSFAVFGLAIIAQKFSAFFAIVRWASMVYLFYLAWQFWHGVRQNMATVETVDRGITSAVLSGLALTLGNPKTIAFYLALLPLVLKLETVSVFNWAAVLVPVTVGVLLMVGGTFILGAMAVRRLLVGAHAQQHIYRGAALGMAGAACTMLWREL